MTVDEAYQLAVRRHRSGQFAEVEALCGQILAADPNHADAIHLLGLMAHNRGQAQQAMELIRRAIGIESKLEYHFNLGLALYALGRYREAGDEYRTVIAGKPDFAEAYSNLGNSLLAEKKVAEAIEVFTIAAQLNPNSADVNNNLGVALHEAQRHEEAAACFRKALASNGQHSEASANLGRTLIALKQYEQAAEAYYIAAIVNPSNPDVHSNLGVALHECKRFDEAAAAFRRALAARPNHAEASVNIGMTLLAQRRFDQAVEAYRKAAALNPNSAEIYNNLGVALHGCRRLEEAIIALRQAVALSPQHHGANANLGNALLAAEKASEASEYLFRAIAICPDEPRTMIRLGSALTVLGMHSVAIAHLERAVKLLPEDAEAHHGLGIAYWQSHQFEDALTHLRRALELRPDDAQTHSDLAATLWHCGPLEESLAEFRHALKLSPDLLSALQGLSISLANCRRFDEAVPYFEQLGRMQQSAGHAPQFPPDGTPPRIVVVCSIRNGRIDLLPHWLEHYSRFKPDKILLGLFEDVSPDLRRQIDRFSDRWKFDCFAQTWNETGELEQQEQRRTACRESGITGNIWIVHTDLDEFHQYPCDLRELIAAAESRGMGAVYGWLLDRVAADGSMAKIPPFTDSNSLWNAFPFGGPITGSLLRAPTGKVMVAKIEIPVGAGHHLAGDLLQWPTPLGRMDQYIVHHFKWHEEAALRLEWGLKHADRNPQWQSESRRFLDWLSANSGKINLKDPAVSPAISLTRLAPF